MKKRLLASLLVPVSILTACGEGIRQNQVPSVVQNALLQAFPPATGVDWEKEEQNYEAAFRQGNAEYNALIDPKGVLLRYKEEVTAEVLPPPVRKTLQDRYGNYQVEEAERVRVGAREYYQVELEKGLKELQLSFTPDGLVSTSLPFWE